MDKRFSGGSNPVDSINYMQMITISCDAERCQVINLSLILLLHEALTGLHIIMLKITSYPVNEVQNLPFGCNIQIHSNLEWSNRKSGKNGLQYDKCYWVGGVGVEPDFDK